MADYQTHDYDVIIIGAGGSGLRAPTGRCTRWRKERW